MENLIRLAEIACEAAIKAGAEFADAACSRGRNLSVDIEKNSIKSCDARWSHHISVRAIYRGGLGWASGDKLDEATAAEMGRGAGELSRLAEPDPDFVTLPSPAEYDDIPGLYDERVASLEIGDLVKIILAEVDGAESVVDDVNVHAGIGCASGERGFANSLGIRNQHISSSISASVMAILRRGDDVGTYYDYDLARVIDDFEPSGIGVRATEMALTFLNARKIETGVMPVILGPLAGIDVFQSVVNSADAEDIQRNRSFLVNMLGKQVASGVVTITDDPTIPRGLSSRGWDAEGVPCRKMTVVEDGVLITYLHNSYTANKAGVPYTGHGTRGGISSSNIIPKLGKKSSQELIREVDDGLYINVGGISPNQTTGEVSASVDFGFKIEKGELAYPVKNTMVAGNFIDMMKNLDAVSSDYRSEPGYVMPTVRIKDVRVAGGI